MVQFLNPSRTSKFFIQASQAKKNPKKKLTFLAVILSDSSSNACVLTSLNIDRVAIVDNRELQPKQ